MEDSKIIDRLGGTAKTAVICKVSMAAVSQWREDGIPRARLMYLKVVRPDVFESEPPVEAAPDTPPN